MTPKPKTAIAYVLIPITAIVVLFAVVARAESPTVEIKTAPAVSDCLPAPAPCGETSGLDGVETAVAQIKAEQDAFLAAVAANQNRSAGGTNTQRSSGGCGEREPLYREGDRLGGSSVPSNIINRESGGNYNSCNKSSTASGRYQVLDSTWAGYGGYARAVDAPMDVQDAWAEEAWAAAGCRPWGCP